MIKSTIQYVEKRCECKVEPAIYVGDSPVIKLLLNGKLLFRISRLRDSLNGELMHAKISFNMNVVMEADEFREYQQISKYAWMIIDTFNRQSVDNFIKYNETSPKRNRR